MLPTNYAALYYIDYWLFVLPKLLGWSRDRVVCWAERFSDELKNENSWLYHQPPSFEVCRLLVPRRFRTDTPPDIDPMRVAAKLEDQFWTSDQNVDALSIFDWEAAIERIDTVLKEYGSSLDEVRRQYQ